MPSKRRKRPILDVRGLSRGVQFNNLFGTGSMPPGGFGGFWRVGASYRAARRANLTLDSRQGSRQVASVG